MDPYEELGIAQDATDDAIKGAFKRLAQRHHPDRDGGDAAKFARLNAAYRTLRDPEKRRAYHEFGTIDSVVLDEREARIRRAAAEVLLVVVDNSDLSTLDGSDLLDRVRKYVDGQIAAGTKVRDVDIPALSTKRKIARDRLMRKNGESEGDLMLMMLEHEIAKLENTGKLISEKIENMQSIRQFFDDYAYVFQERTGFISMFTSATTL